MNCPNCTSDNLSVVDSRDCDAAIRRRRQCLACNHRFTTYERIEVPVVIVVKKDGRRERFSRDKLIGGITMACKNRPIEQARIIALADLIEKDINILGEEEISSHYIGDKVLSNLKELDQVAYIRFSSVHKSFNDLKAFEREIDKVQKQI